MKKQFTHFKSVILCFFYVAVLLFIQSCIVANHSTIKFCNYRAVNDHMAIDYDPSFVVYHPGGIKLSNDIVDKRFSEFPIQTVDFRLDSVVLKGGTITGCAGEYDAPSNAAGNDYYVIEETKIGTHVVDIFLNKREGLIKYTLDELLNLTFAPGQTFCVFCVYSKK